MNRILPTTSVEEIAALISEALESHGISAVLSGGTAVTLYSQHRYVSGDLDFVTSASYERLSEALADTGFERTQSRYFAHPATHYVIDFPAGPLAVGGQRLTDWHQLETPWGVVQILTATQCVMDRLAAWYYWSDPQGLDQALLVARSHDVEIAEVERWSASEGFEEQFGTFERQLRGSPASS